MISRVAGMVVDKGVDSAVIDVAGIGYEVLLSSGDMEKILIDESVAIHTYHHIREQAQELFGFSTLEAKKLFELLITVQGVGPKAAMAILSIDQVEVVRNAIANSDHAFISRANGVGKKTAERVIVDLHDKVGFAAASKIGLMPAGDWGSARGDDAANALVALGFSESDAVAALKTISIELPVAERVTAALRNLR